MNLIKAITFLLCSTLLVGQTTPIRNPQIQGASGAIISGATLTNSGTFVNSGTLNGAGTFNFGSGTVTLPASSVTSGNITDGAIVNADINASAAIDISKLASSAITIAGTSTSLGGSITASAILDSISSTQGTILYRGASGWSALSPGTSGHFLKTQGAGANPMWDAAAGSGSVATDAIWDAAGDLAVGTGANTAARLAIGANGYVLTSNGTTASWAAPSAGISGLTATRVTFATGATTIGDDADLTFVTDTLSGTALKINATATTAATNSTSGALIVAGGAGISKDSWINGIRVGRGGGDVNSNTALGEGAMAATATGINNVAIGENVLAALLGGNRNMMIGHESGNDVTSGSENAGAGNQALYSVTTGNYNSGFGAGTLSAVTTASSNTALGYQAGTYRNAGLSTLLVNPSNSIYIGDNAIGNADSETNAIVIGSAAIGEGSNKTVIGNSSTTNARIYGQLYGYPINVKSYGARGDARKVTDAVLNGTTTVTSATAAFTSADTGKVVWGVETATGAAVLPVGTATYVNSTTITCSVSATGSYTGVSLVIGTDDTAEIQAAATAADAMSPKGQVYIPSGGYVFSDRLFNQSYAAAVETYSIAGDGSSVTKLFPSPSHALTGTVVFNTESSTQMQVIRGLQIDGSSYEFAGSPGVTQAGGYAIWDDVKIVNFKGISNTLNVQTANGRFYNCHFENSSYVGILVAGGAEFYGCYSGNHGYIALHVSGATVLWTGGTLDECTGPSIYLANSTLRLSNALVYAGGSQNACETTGTSSIHASGSRFVPFGANNNCTGILLASSGTARLVNCILTGSGTGYGLNNSGTVYDVGGNTFTTTTGTAPVDALSSVVSVAHGGTGASSLTNLITLGTMTTGNYVADVAGTANEITSTHTPGEGSTATLSLPSAMTFTGKTVTGGTYSAPTISGAATLSENASIALDPAGSADGKYSGTTVTGTAGATLAFGDVVVLDVTDSRWELADANSAAAADGDSRALLGICVLAAASDGSATTILLQGIVRADTAFPALTVGAPVYVGETAGDAVVTQPTTADVVIRVIGHALTADEMFFNPDLTWITHL